MNDAGQFYTNRVLKDWKDKDKKHVEWTKAWVATLAELQVYVKDHHTTGLVWNPKGVDAKSLAKSSPPPPPPAGGPPLPPPPPPPGLFDDVGKAEEDPSKAGRGALFAEINQGADITKGRGTNEKRACNTVFSLSRLEESYCRHADAQESFIARPRTGRWRQAGHWAQAGSGRRGQDRARGEATQV